jgi:hypothetical protein
LNGGNGGFMSPGFRRANEIASFPMKTRLTRLIGFLTVAALAGIAARASAQTNFDVTNPTNVFQYFIDGTNNTGTGPGSILSHPTNNCPPLTLAAGATYTFNISVSSTHPFEIVTNSPGPAAIHYTNATPTSTTMGTITLVIPATNFPSTLYYECNQHFFYGVITVVPPVAGPPPPNAIISIIIGPDTVTMISSGTNTTYSLVPQFDSNVIDGNWQDVPSFTNSFANGTNTTIFERLDSICGSNVFLRITQRP